MQVPAALLQSLSGVPGFDAAAFEAVHSSGKKITSVRINPAKAIEVNAITAGATAVPWSQRGYYLPERPSFTLDPFLHAGAYYVQEASSMFLEQALRQTADLSAPLTVLDLCAAPGGKSTHIQSLLSEDSVLVSNEVIKTRVTILAENLTKWGAANAIVVNNDPAEIGKLESLFDVIVVDAPCSGSGLFRKEPEAIEEWSEANVQLCSQRQQRILADVWPALKPGGVLIYSTCSYSSSEDETIADWLTESFQAENLPLALQKEWGIIPTHSPQHQNEGYRFFPHLLDGEGFYIVCFRKPDTDANYFTGNEPRYQPDKKLIAVADKWLKPHEDLRLFQHKEQAFAMPQYTWELFMQIQKHLNVRKAGVRLGDIMRDELLPDHALALSDLYHPDLPVLELSREDALQYLRKAGMEASAPVKGWMMVAYQQQRLGWIKSLGNRINNYYPKEWRIRL